MSLKKQLENGYWNEKYEEYRESSYFWPQDSETIAQKSTVRNDVFFIEK